LNGNYNSLSIGVQVQLPFLDRGRTAKARESLADAQHALHETAFLREQQTEDLLKLQHSVSELSAKAELAELDEGIAQDQLDAMLIELRLGSGNRSAAPMTPKDEQITHLQERQKYLDFLDAKLQLFDAQISLLRQTGVLDSWLKSLARPEILTPAKP
jgi:hypothetical protein